MGCSLRPVLGALPLNTSVAGPIFSRNAGPDCQSSWSESDTKKSGGDQVTGHRPEVA